MAVAVAVVPVLLVQLGNPMRVVLVVMGLQIHMHMVQLIQ